MNNFRVAEILMLYLLIAVYTSNHLRQVKLTSLSPAKTFFFFFKLYREERLEPRQFIFFILIVALHPKTYV